MSKKFTSFLICALFLIVVQECHGVMKVPFQDNLVLQAFTPVNANGDLNLEVIPRLAQYYNDNNLKVINVCGYYGGAASLPLPDRKRVVEAWAEQAKRYGFDLVVEIGAMTYVDTLELASFCSQRNVTAITAFAEIVYQATTLAEALQDLQRICDASHNLPLLYHELAAVGQNIKTDQIFVGAMGGRVSCFVGVITTVNTFLDMKAAVDAIDGYQFWVYGQDAIAAAYKVGMNATDGINLFPDLTRRIRDAVNNCQLTQAADLQQELNRRMYAITNVNGGVVGYYEQVKTGFELLTCIELENRYPFETPNATVIGQMRSNLENLGVQLCRSDSKN